jgi:DNA-directed RNA polymerase subunit RPC12/RpoP
VFKEYLNLIECPYCHHEEFAKSLTLPRFYQCKNCRKSFNLYTIATIEYEGRKNCNLNNESHEMIPANHPLMRRCIKCKRIEWKGNLIQTTKEENNEN